MTGESGAHRLFRRPRRPKLEKIDLTHVKEPDHDLSKYADDSSSTASSDELEQSNERHEYARLLNAESGSNKIKLPYINNKRIEAAARKSSNSSKLVILEADELVDNISMAKTSKVAYENNKSSQSISDSTMSTSTDDFSASNAKNKSLTTKKFNSAALNCKYIMDKSRQSNYSTRSLLQPSKPLGPDPLPARAVKLHRENAQLRKSYYKNLGYSESEGEEENDDPFIFNDFLLNATDKDQCAINSSSQVSKYTYNQICKILEEKIQRESNRFPNNIHVQTLTPNVVPFENRRPLRQTMIEMAFYLKKELSLRTGANLKTKFTHISKWQNPSGAHTELLIYEDKTQRKEEPFEEEEEEISAAQFAIVDSLLRNGLVLNLKANFIDELPDLTPLRSSLVYINLSYNHFEQIPEELFTIYQLEVLKMRNNPIKSVSDRLQKLQNLKLLNLAYCQLKDWPECLCEMKNLQFLDLSYNRLKEVEENIVRMKSLSKLNLEGNEIECLPCCMLYLPYLTELNVKNNYLHPLIWRNLMINDVQSLVEISAAKFVRQFGGGEDSQEFFKLSEKVQAMIKENLTRCDCCEGKRFGAGLKIVKPFVKIFGVKYLPFLFYSCSPQCYHEFKSRTEF